MVTHQLLPELRQVLGPLFNLQNPARAVRKGLPHWNNRLPKAVVGVVNRKILWSLKIGVVAK